MIRPTILWVDLRVQSNTKHVEEILSPLWNVCRENDTDNIADRISQVEPLCLIFDYDYPDHERLSGLRETKRRFPWVPILMLTKQHCESLAIWAFRVGVRDYLHSPVQEEELVSRVKLLSSLLTKTEAPRRRIGHLASQHLPAPPACETTAAEGKRPGKDSLNEVGPRKAIAYIESHLGDTISLDEIATHCGMGPFAFSRAFKKEFGTTFQEYVIRRRVDKAQELLQTSRISVTEVAQSVGFGDLSHFIRTFRRLSRCSPTAYRKKNFPEGQPDRA